MVKKSQKAYLLPAVVDPGAYWTFCVHVPAHLDYLLTFWASLDFLAKWNAYERDDAHTAKDVAAVWRAANQLTRANFNAGGCGEVDMARIHFRPKPGASWVEQYRYDDEPEGVWHDKNIQAHWPVTVVPDVSEWADAQEQAGTIVRGWHEWLVESILGGISAVETKEQTVNAIMGQIGQYAHNPSATRNAINQAYDAVADLPTPTAEPYTEDCGQLNVWQKLFELIKAAGPDWLNGLSDMMSGALNDASDALQETLNFAAGTLLGEKLSGFASKNAGAGGGANFGGECEWTKVWDLTAALSPFEIIPYPGEESRPLATWVSGEGIKMSTDDPLYLYLLAFKYDFPYPVNWERVIIGVSVGAVGSNRALVTKVNEQADCGQTDFNYSNNTTNSIVFLRSNDSDCDEDATKLLIWAFSEFAPDTVARIEIRGMGANPFGS